MCKKIQICENFFILPAISFVKVRKKLVQEKYIEFRLCKLFVFFQVWSKSVSNRSNILNVENLKSRQHCLIFTEDINPNKSYCDYQPGYNPTITTLPTFLLWIPQPGYVRGHHTHSTISIHGCRFIKKILFLENISYSHADILMLTYSSSHT